MTRVRPHYPHNNWHKGQLNNQKRESLYDQFPMPSPPPARTTPFRNHYSTQSSDEGFLVAGVPKNVLEEGPMALQAYFTAQNNRNMLPYKPAITREYSQSILMNNTKNVDNQQIEIKNTDSTYSDNCTIQQQIFKDENGLIKQVNNYDAKGKLDNYATYQADGKTMKTWIDVDANGLTKQEVIRSLCVKIKDVILCFGHFYYGV